MKPLLLTLTLLLFLSTFVVNHLQHFSEKSILTALNSNYVKTREKCAYEKEYQLLKEIKAQEPEKKTEEKENKNNKGHLESNEPKKETFSHSHYIRSLHFNLYCPPNNSRFNIYLLLHENLAKREKLKEMSRYEIALRLLQRLYGEHSYFKARPNLFSALVDELILKKDQTELFTYPDELASLTFEDAALQKAFAIILRGGFDEEGNRFPSFLHYITFDRAVFGVRRKINLLFAPKVLLEVLLKNPEITNKVLIARKQLFERLFMQEHERKSLSKDSTLNRTEISQWVKATFSQILSEHGMSLPQFEMLFDFTLGKEGNILFLSDPDTKIEIREKI